MSAEQPGDAVGGQYLGATSRLGVVFIVYIGSRGAPTRPMANTRLVTVGIGGMVGGCSVPPTVGAPDVHPRGGLGARSGGISGDCDG